MLKRLITGGMCLLFWQASQVTAQTVVSGFNFNGTTSGATSSNSFLYNADRGNGNVTFNGSGVSFFTGTTQNAFTGDASGMAYSPLNGTSSVNNGKSLLFSFDASAFTGLTFSYATQRTNTGFTTQTISTSIDGTTFSQVGTVSPGTSFAATQLFDVSALDNAANAIIRITLTGASGSSQNNRFDNVQITGMPEPSVAVLVGSAALPLLGRRRSRALSAACSLV